MYKKFSYFVATMFGVGYCPFASGTAGSLATLPFAFAAAYYGGTVGIIPAFAYFNFFKRKKNSYQLFKLIAE